IDPANTARAALAAGDPEKGLRVAQANVAAQPSDVGATRLNAIVCSELGNADAERAWRRVLALSDGDPVAHYMLGNAAGDRGDFTAAADHFRAALVRAPAHPQIRASLGLALFQQRRYAEALHYFDAIAKHFPVTHATLTVAYAACLSFAG